MYAATKFAKDAYGPGVGLKQIVNLLSGYPDTVILHGYPIWVVVSSSLYFNINLQPQAQLI